MALNTSCMAGACPNISGVLSWIQYSGTDLAKRMKEQIDAKVREGGVKPKEGVDLQNFYEDVLNGYTYMDVEKQARFAQQAEEAALVRLNQKLQANADRIPPGVIGPIVKPRSIDDVPILALTADYSDQTRRDCLANGMQDFLSKPVDATALWNSIRKQLGLA